MNNKVIIGVALLVSFAAGRWAAPEKVKIETRTVEVEKKDSTVQKEQDRNQHKETTETEVTRPDGTIEKTKKTVDAIDTHQETDKHDTSDTSKATETEKEVTRSSGKVTLAVLAGIKFTSVTAGSPILYGAQVYRPIVGPIGIGIWGLSDLTFGVSVGLSL